MSDKNKNRIEIVKDELEQFLRERNVVIEVHYDSTAELVGTRKDDKFHDSIEFASFRECFPGEEESK